MAQVVVTGGHGFVGSHVVERLARQGDEITVYDPDPRPPDLSVGPARVRHVAGDVRDEKALAEAIRPGTDVVYHLAAVVGVDRYLARPLDVIEVNVLGTRNVLRRAAAVGAFVVVASTSEVYGRNPSTPWDEDADRVLGSTSADRWSYSTSKAAAEHLTYAFARQEGLSASIVRYFNLYGPRQRPAYVLSRTVHRLLHGMPPLVYDGGTQTRCFTYVEDAADATVRIPDVEAARGQSFNIGSDREIMVADVVRLATRLVGTDVPPQPLDTSVALGARYQDIPRRVPAVAKARRLLGWQCVTPLDVGLRRTITWARDSEWMRLAPA
ncbi:NAD-dependent epimerase/dehydratase family protein [Micromonospora sp. NPDC003776]